MRIVFRSAKDLAIPALHGILRLTTSLPAGATKVFASSVGLLFKSYYHLPGSHARETMTNFCRLIDHSDPRSLYFQVVDNTMLAATLFALAMREGSQALVELTDFAEGNLARCRALQEESGAAVFVSPHCASSVLSGARLSSEFPVVAVLREPRSETRTRIVRQYFDRLGLAPLMVRRADPVSLARRILRAFHDKKFVLGTTDLLRPSPDVVEVKCFGLPVRLPVWPARFAGRRGVPIVPMYARLTNGRILVTTGEPYRESDLVVATQRWVDFFEESIRQSPADWVFMLDKYWSRAFATRPEKLCRT